MLSSYICAAIGGCMASAAATGPVVDLGYGLWQASINDTGLYYNFSNIRYAQPPINQLRFAVPQKPIMNRTVVNDGQDGRICIQGYTSWAKERSMFIRQYLSNPNNISAFTSVPAPGQDVTSNPPPQADGRATEDCLFLDVIVPKAVFDNANKTTAAPVMMWAHGGGFYEGWKDSQGDPAGFVRQSMTNPVTAPGVVYVAINYRLGAFGWLSGPTFAGSGGTPNVGLYDQRLALDWIHDNIHRFGGDPQKVTMMGESAGASSALHQIAAFGGSQGDAPFHQAVMLSPAFNPNPYNVVQEQTYQKFLAAANVSTLAQLRSASSQAVVKANSFTIWTSPYGSSGGYGPVVDGNFVPQLPLLLLQQGRYSKNVKSIFAAHNTNEGLIFTNPAVQNTSAFNAFVNGSASPLLPDAQASVKNQIVSALYPPIFDNKTALGYNDTISRLSTLLADFLVNCNAQTMLETWGANRTHGFLFAEGPGLHGEDTPYFFFNDGPTEDAYGFGSVNTTVAKVMQNWVLSFGGSGDPNAKGNPPIPVYGSQRELGLLSNAGVGLSVPDPAGKQRCDFWKQALYF